MIFFFRYLSFFSSAILFLSYCCCGAVLKGSLVSCCGAVLKGNLVCFY